MQPHWIEEIGPILELQQLLDDLVDYGRVEQDIESSEWWKEEVNETLS